MSQATQNPSIAKNKEAELGAKAIKGKQQQRANPYEIITQRVLELLEAGTIPWRKPWSVSGILPSNLKSKAPYRGINAFLLACAPFGSPYWLTFRQAKDLGGSVKKGEKGWPVIFWKWIEKLEDGEKVRYPVLRRYTVFNIEQCEGIESPDSAERANCWDPIDAAEQISKGFKDGPEIQVGGPRAAYFPVLDLIRVPERCAFAKPSEFYCALFHEQVHGSGHPKRLGRFELAGQEFGSTGYSKEELIAEMGAAFLCAQAGIEQETLENSASYIAGWLKQIRRDNRLVVQAAAQAQRAADLILGRKFDTEN